MRQHDVSLEVQELTLPSSGSLEYSLWVGSCWLELDPIALTTGSLPQCGSLSHQPRCPEVNQRTLARFTSNSCGLITARHDKSAASAPYSTLLDAANDSKHPFFVIGLVLHELPIVRVTKRFDQ